MTLWKVIAWNQGFFSLTVNTTTTRIEIYKVQVFKNINPPRKGTFYIFAVGLYCLYKLLCSGTWRHSSVQTTHSDNNEWTAMWIYTFCRYCPSFCPLTQSQQSALDGFLCVSDWRQPMFQQDTHCFSECLGGSKDICPLDLKWTQAGPTCCHPFSVYCLYP